MEIPKAMCFVAMPFGTKPSPSDPARQVDFDSVYECFAAAITAERLDCIRADFEPYGGFVHQAMFERLLVAEYVVVDVTFWNPNVMYEVGVRHGGSVGATILLCAQESLRPAFDFRPFRIIPYALDAQGKIAPPESARLQTVIRERIQHLRTSAIPDNPVLQVTRLRPSTTGHEKTDVFAARMKYASAIGERVHAALAGERGAALDRLNEIRREISSGVDQLRELHSGLLALYLGYREIKAYQEMIALFEAMPPELKATPIAREQAGLAWNRLAEQAAGRGDHPAARQLQARALAAAELPVEQCTSETYGILGRIYKGASDAAQLAGDEPGRRGFLTRAIEAYETGFRLDPRDYYPGVNAVTLRSTRGSPEDPGAVEALLPVVRFAVDRAPPPSRNDERYWQRATKLELACLARDWTTARTHQDALVAIDVPAWMRETTISTLQRLRSARTGDAEAQQALAQIIDALTPR
ncbi:MAG TPA: TRAFs-binding domain-containing protein [Kofleriaceae bacterium]|jgi:tetratricopeptide (TPR) repeat protein|nr:TRAFs-binding domain-containing protein [Kofleriaceae bacterium]